MNEAKRTDEGRKAFEECIRCGAHTGKAGFGEDSLFIVVSGEDKRPLCEYCYDYYTEANNREVVREMLEGFALMLKDNPEPGLTVKERILFYAGQLDRLEGEVRTYRERFGFVKERGEHEGE